MFLDRHQKTHCSGHSHPHFEIPTGMVVSAPDDGAKDRQFRFKQFEGFVRGFPTFPPDREGSGLREFESFNFPPSQRSEADLEPAEKTSQRLKQAKKKYEDDLRIVASANEKMGALSLADQNMLKQLEKISQRTNLFRDSNLWLRNDKVFRQLAA